MKTRIIVGLLVVAAALGAAVLWDDRAAIEAELAEPPPAVRAGRPGSAEVTESVSGTLWASTGQPSVVQAPTWQGLVTAVHVAPGDTAGDGTDVVSIDGIIRQLAVTDSPFHRFLTTNDTGSDVEALHELLHRWGHLAEIPSRPHLFGYRTRVAVRSLAAEIGADPRTRSFDPAWLIWAPRDAELAVARVGLKVGEAAPQLSEVILESTFGITEFSLEPADSSRELRLDGEWLLSVTIENIPSYELAVRDGAVSAEVLTELLDAASRAGAIELMPRSRYSFTFSGESATTSEVLTVPAASLRASADGATLCVFARESDAVPWSAVVVSPEESPGSSVAIADAPELAAQEVLFNPSEILEDPYCP